MNLMDIWPIPANPPVSRALIPADDLPPKRLKNYLCTAARPTASILNLAQCEVCESPCAYGKRYLLLEKERRAASETR